MSGFEIFNEHGKLTIDSSNRSTLFYDLRATGITFDKSSFSISSPFGNGSTLGYIPTTLWNDGNLRWLQLSPGKYGMPGANLLEDNAGNIIRTSRYLNMQSGYLDVFDASGALIWSALSASQMPRVMSFIDIPAGYDLQNNTAVFTLGFNPWILVNACPGNASDDGTGVGYSGLLIKWTGSQLQVRYVSKNQKSWSQTFMGYGIRVPLAQFVGI